MPCIGYCIDEAAVAAEDAMRRSRERSHVPAGAQIALLSCAVCMRSKRTSIGELHCRRSNITVVTICDSSGSIALACIVLGSMNVSCLQRVQHLSHTMEFCAPAECRSMNSRRRTLVTRCSGPAAEESEASSSGRPATHSAPQRGSRGPQKGLRVCCIK